jgi:hypothetical protein
MSEPSLCGFKMPVQCGQGAVVSFNTAFGFCRHFDPILSLMAGNGGSHIEILGCVEKARNGYREPKGKRFGGLGSYRKSAALSCSACFRSVQEPQAGYQVTLVVFGELFAIWRPSNSQADTGIAPSLEVGCTK